MKPRIAGKTAEKASGSAGFTLVELLVVIGIIALLMSILLPALSRARSSAAELKSESGLRQMMTGYVLYYQDHHGALMYGHTPPTVNGAPVTVYDKNADQTYGYPVSDRYPWRLVNYVGDVWAIIHSHESVPPVPNRGDSANEAFLKAYSLSVTPTYGINSIYVGGDADHDGFVNGKPNLNHHAVFRASEVHRPSELIVFADAQAANASSLAGQGYHLLAPPRSHGENWKVVDGLSSPVSQSLMGLPRGWYNPGTVVVGFFDTHVEKLPVSKLADMRLWCEHADSPTWDY